METPQAPQGGELLKKLFSEDPVHGLGRERFTAEQRADVENLFNKNNIPFADHVLDRVYGSTVMDMIDYVNCAPGSDEKKALASTIEAELLQALDSVE